MAQLLALYNTPADPADFDRYYHETHIPIAKKIPGLRSYRISNGPVQALAGNAPHLVAILDFDSMARRLIRPHAVFPASPAIRQRVSFSGRLLRRRDPKVWRNRSRAAIAVVVADHSRDPPRAILVLPEVSETGNAAAVAALAGRLCTLWVAEQVNPRFN